MQFTKPDAELYVPDKLSESEALARTTHMGISAHQDDLEIMAYPGIAECYRERDKWFGGIVATDGRGAPSTRGEYKDYTPEQMVAVRCEEQKKAAYLGGYSFQALLNWESREMRNKDLAGPTEEIQALIDAARPQVIYTHNLCDKHPTHVAVAVRTIWACRKLPVEARPSRILGCEVWRDLDWLRDGDKEKGIPADKVVLDCTGRENLQAALLGLYDSQISGGKRYDLATLGRRRANATYLESHEGDVYELVSFAMDLTPLIQDEALCLKAYVRSFIDHLYEDVAALIGNMTG